MDHDTRPATTAGHVPPPAMAVHRPASLVVLGILGIVFGVLGIVVTLAQGATLAFGMASVGIRTPIVAMMNHNPALRPLLHTWLAVAGGAAVVLITGGVGLLRSSRWGRTLSTLYGCYATLAAVVGIVVNWLMFLHLRQEASNGASWARGALVAVIWCLIAESATLTYGVVLLLFMRCGGLRTAAAAPATGR